MSRDPFFACRPSAWQTAAELLAEVGTRFPREVAEMDLRCMADQVRVGRLGRVPSRRKLMARWGWTDHEVRSLLRDEPSWADLSHQSPNRLPTVSQPPPAIEAITRVEPSAVSHPSPNDLPNLSTGADLHPTHNTQTHTQAGRQASAEALPPQPLPAPAPAVQLRSEAPACLPARPSQDLSADTPTTAAGIYPELCEQLSASGLHTLGDLARHSRDSLADLTGCMSARRLDHIDRRLRAAGLRLLSADEERAQRAPAAVVLPFDDPWADLDIGSSWRPGQSRHLSDVDRWQRESAAERRALAVAK